MFGRQNPDGIITPCGAEDDFGACFGQYVFQSADKLRIDYVGEAARIIGVSAVQYAVYIQKYDFHILLTTLFGFPEQLPAPPVFKPS